MVESIICFKKGDCGKPPRLNNGFPVTDLTQTSFPVGTKIRYRCNEGFSLAQGKSPFITCQADSSWTAFVTVCEARSCGAPPDIENGYYEATSVVFGGRVTYYCDEGYDLIGRSSQNCIAEGWDGRTPVCDPVKCPDLPPIANGRTPPLFTDFWEYPNSATYKCNAGFTLIGQKTITCLVTGRWNHKPPECKVVECWRPDPPIKNGMIKSGFGPKYKYREAIIYQCNEGFRMFGKDMVQCRADNTFEPAPLCIPVGDPDPTSVSPEYSTFSSYPGSTGKHNAVA
eukprot:gi/632963247/ref/XP_007897774.1/ PREDICTED: C4b-binding protein alpha chain-like [Callorhinchus milii]